MTCVVNILTIDLEDYWSIVARDWLGQSIEPTEAVLRNTEWLLGVLAEYNVKGTFFVLGEIAKKFPFLIRTIVEQGHEAGVHGFYHQQVFKLNAEQFRREITDTKKLIEDIISENVVTHRAPAFSIMRKTQWAFEVLAQEGFKYDSSVFPIAARRYGWPGFSQDICTLTLPSGAIITEVPLPTVTVFGRRLPAAGGGYLRHFPYLVTKLAARRIQKNRPVVTYIHPYEIDLTSGPKELEAAFAVASRRAKRFHALQLRNRQTIKYKLNRLFTDFRFSTLQDVAGAMLADNKTALLSLPL